MKPTNAIIFSFLSLFLFVACGNKTKNELIHTYLLFNAPVSCISSSSLHKDSILYAGLENGNIFRVNFITGDKQLISTDFVSRIYDILEDSTALWLGVRNLGLVKWSLQRGTIERQYTIDVPMKNDTTIKNTTRYATYDIEMDGAGNLFLGTSSGVYRLNRDEKDNGQDSLKLICRRDYEKNHFGTGPIKIFKGALFCATNSGLIIRDHCEEPPFINKKISHLYQGKDTLYASSDFLLYKIYSDSVGFAKDSVPFNDGNLCAYIVDATTYTGKWVIKSTGIEYANNEGKIQPFSLPERMDKNYRNYLCLGKDFLFFSCGMKVYSLALHQNPKGKSNSIIAACTKGDTCYFISGDHCLYAYHKKNSRTEFISNITCNENILRMCASGTCLWFITDKMGLYKINLEPSFFWKINPFKDTYEATLYFQSDGEDDLKSLYYDKNNLYVGSRYVLRVIPNPEKFDKKNIQPVERDIKSPRKDMYVTGICKHQDTIFISSLNHGLLKLIVGDTLLCPVVTAEEVGSIYEMMEVDGEREKILLHASKGMFYYSVEKGTVPVFPANDKLKSIQAIYKGCYIGYQGIGKMDTHPDSSIKLEPLSNLDIAFNNASITKGITNENFVLLGSQAGLYEYNGEKLTNITIEYDTRISQKILLATIGLMVFLLVSLWIFYNDFFLPENLKEISERSKKCKKKIEDVIKKEEQFKLLNVIDKIQSDHKKINTQKKIVEKIFRIKRHITFINRSKKKLGKIEARIEKTQITRREVIDILNSHIKEATNAIEQYTHLLDSPGSFDKIRTHLADKSNHTITSSKESLAQLISFNTSIIETYAPKKPADSEVKQDLTAIEELFRADDFNEVKELLNGFIGKYGNNYLAELSFMSHNNTKGFATILCCTNLKNKEIDSFLEKIDSGSGQTNASSYFKDIIERIKKIEKDKKNNSLIDRIKKGIADRQRKKP
jgi:hypothetical protein